MSKYKLTEALSKSTYKSTFLLYTNFYKWILSGVNVTLVRIPVRLQICIGGDDGNGGIFSFKGNQQCAALVVDLEDIYYGISTLLFLLVMYDVTLVT